MNQSLTCIALLFAVFLVAYGGRGPNRGSGESGGQRPGGPGGQRPDGSGPADQLASKLCANLTLAQAFVTQMQQLFTTLQANGSFTQVLADRAQEVAYIRNADNTALLSTNCTAYFSNLKTAIDADRAIVETREQYQRIAAKATMDIITNLIGRRRY